MIIVMESPFAGGFGVDYARSCMEELLREGHTPFPSHLLYTQVLDDDLPEERDLGIEAGLQMYEVADLCVVFIDHGISPGMQRGIDRAKEKNVPIKYRSLRIG